MSRAPKHDQRIVHALWAVLALLSVTDITVGITDVNQSESGGWVDVGFGCVFALLSVSAFVAVRKQGRRSTP